MIKTDKYVGDPARQGELAARHDNYLMRTGKKYELHFREKGQKEKYSIQELTRKEATKLKNEMKARHDIDNRTISIKKIMR